MSIFETGEMAPPTVPATRAAPAWVVPVVVAAVVVGLAGLGVGIYAVATTPAKTSGPRGPVGPAGADGSQGPQGVTGTQGAVGAAGPAGPSGTLGSTAIAAGPTLTSAPNPPVGTVLVAKTSCPTGTILLSGSAQVTATGVVADRNVELRESLPIAPNVWQTVALVTASLGQGMAMSMKPYVVCGVEFHPPAPKAKTTTTTTTTTVPPT